MAATSKLENRRVVRMNGAGNKILVLDLRGAGATPSPADARAIHRAPGLDFDQLMTIEDSRDLRSIAYVRILNNDGSEVEACGNGTRCVADRLARETGRDRLTVETQAGLIACERLGEATYRVDMGRPRFDWAAIPIARPVEDTRAVDILFDGETAPAFGPAGLVNMGNPHAVFFVADAATVDLGRWGPAYETHKLFPQKTNVSFAEILSHDVIQLRVWERGVGATLACGSAACATLVAAARRGLAAREARVALPGGDLTIAWSEADDRARMTGPVVFERELVLTPEIFTGPGA
jgi:diaminopimelate epimerase